MKGIKDLRTQLNEMAEGDADMRKLSALVRSGLFDAKKLTLLKRALKKDNMKMSKAERDTLLDLLDRLLNVVTDNQQVFQKIKQTVSEELIAEDYEFSMARSQLKTIIRDAEALLAQIQGEGEMESWMQSKITLASDYIGAVADNVVSGESEIKKLKEEYVEYTLEEAAKLGVDKDINQIPALLVLKRRAIRVFPDGQKVALYYSDRLNKFVTVPFTSIGLSENLNEAKVDWAWQQGYAKRHAAANDDTLSPQDRANAAQELADYHNRTTKRFGKPAADSLKSTFQQQLSKAQQSRQAAAARSKAMAQRGASDKQARRAASQKDLRSTLKSNAVKDFGKAYNATSGNLAGSLGIALGRSIRRAALKTKTLSRDIKRSASPGAGPLREAFQNKLQQLKEAQDNFAGSAFSGANALNLYYPRAIKPPKDFQPYDYDAGKELGNMVPANTPNVPAALPLPAAIAAGAAGLASMFNKTDVTPPQKRVRPPKPAEIDIPNYTEPKTDVTPKQEPVVAPQPATFAEPYSATAPKTAPEPAAQTNVEPKGPRGRGGKRSKSVGKLDLPIVPIVPFDISAGKGRTSTVGKVSGIDPFQSNAVKLGGAGAYGTAALQQKLAAQSRAATKAMANIQEKTDNDDSEDEEDKPKKSSSKGSFDITYPTSSSSSRSLNTLKGYNPFERASDGAKSGPYGTPALNMQQQLLQIRANQAMSQRQYNESVIDTLKTIVSEDIDSKELQIGKEYITINNGMAKKIVHVYESVNKINKVKMEKMLNENVDGFTKILQFATKN